MDKILTVVADTSLTNIDFRFAPFKRGVWRKYDVSDGMADVKVHAIHQAPDGMLWFGSGDSFIQDSYLSPDGSLWVGTNEALVHYGNPNTGHGTPVVFPQLMNESVSVIHPSPDGTLWIGTGGSNVRGNGVFRYNTSDDALNTFTQFLPGQRIFDIQSDLAGVVWVACLDGLYVHDGETFTQVPLKNDASAITEEPWAIAIHCDRVGQLWVGTWGGWEEEPNPNRWGMGIFKFDGKRFVNYTQASHGVADDIVWDIESDAAGDVWFGTERGVSRYDGIVHRTTKRRRDVVETTPLFVRFDQTDGLAGNYVQTIHHGSDDVLWFGTRGSGVSGYDGVAWTSLDTWNGLANNQVFSIRPGIGDELWFGTKEGLTCYRPGQEKSGVEILAVTTDRTYRDLSAVPPVTSGQRVTITYNAIDFKTQPTKRQYRCRIKEVSSDWFRPTRASSFDYTFNAPGTYTVEVQAIDRDFNYSEPVSLTLNVVSPWYQNGWVLFPSGGGILALSIYAVISTLRYLTRNRQLASAHDQIQQQHIEIGQLNERLQDENVRMGAELAVTEQIQRLILPSKAELSAIGHLDIAAYMSPADEVGGDYYDVLQHNGRLKIAIGDVTGHGMQAGMVMMMTQSIIRALVEGGETDPVRVMDMLNRAIYGNMNRMEAPNNLTLCLLDYADGEVKLSGQHDDPILVRANGVVESVDTAELGFPIGLDDEIADFIGQTTIELAPGDGVVLYTDGITEAENAAKDQYGLDRLCQVVSQHWAQSAESIKDAVVADLEGFIGDAEIYDDITLVILKQV